MTSFRSRSPSTATDQRADWLAWSLQLAFGFVFGLALGWVVFEGSRRRLSGFSEDQRAAAWWGLALFFAGLASLHGDRLWLRSSYRVIPPRDIEHSKLSRFISIAACAIGALLFVTAMLFRLGVF